MVWRHPEDEKNTKRRRRRRFKKDYGFV